jgi:hypothetical protein
MDIHSERRPRRRPSYLRVQRRVEVETGTDELRGMIDHVRRRGLNHQEARAVRALLQTIRRLLPDEDL